MKFDCDHDCGCSSVLNDALGDFLDKQLHLLLSSSAERYAAFRSCFSGTRVLILQINNNVPTAIVLERKSTFEFMENSQVLLKRKAPGGEARIDQRVDNKSQLPRLL